MTNPIPDQTYKQAYKTNREWKHSRFVCLSSLLYTALLLMSTTGCISIDFLGMGAGAPLEESVVAGSGGPKVLLLEIDGVISGVEVAPSFLGLRATSMVARVREVLDRAREDEEVRGILLRIDSPGGTATASEQVYTEILRFKRERDIPVVAQLLTTAASGGYYIAMAADSIQAHPTTVVGSIGVIFTSMNFAGLMGKLGIEDQTVTGGEFKDMGSPFRKLTTTERAQLQSIVNDLHARFREIVDLGRPDLSTEEVAALANGMIYSAPQALANGLIDSVGNLEEAVDIVAAGMGAPEVQVVAYHRSRGGRRNLYMRSAAPSPARFGAAVAAVGSEGLAEAWATATLQQILARPGFHYLWWPGLMGQQ